MKNEAPALFDEAVLVDVNTATAEAIDTLPEFISDKMKSSDKYDKRFRGGMYCVNKTNTA